MMLSRRMFLSYMVASGAGLGLLAAWGPPTPQTAPAVPSAPTAPQKLNEPPSISTAAPVTSATPQPTTAAATGQPQPQGQFNYVWHTTISPAWLDPQENPPQITPYNFAYALHDALVK